MSGGSVLSIGRGAALEFVPSARFQIGIALTDRASQTVTVSGVRAVAPHGSVFRQLGTALAVPKRFWGCGISKPASFGALRPKPLRVAPGKYACVQLNFALLGCPAALHASLQDVRLVDVSYRTPAGAIIHQRVGLGDMHLKIVPTVEHTLVGDRWARRAVRPCSQ
jgi:hypothetical protein